MGNFLRILGEAPLDAEVHFLEPVPASPDARRRMAETARARIEQSLGPVPASAGDGEPA
jgi:1-acyl-sn-glycerol-3-phosphate acyltransferase